MSALQRMIFPRTPRLAGREMARATQIEIPVVFIHPLLRFFQGQPHSP